MKPSSLVCVLMKCHISDLLKTPMSGVWLAFVGRYLDVSGLVFLLHTLTDSDYN